MCGTGAGVFDSFLCRLALQIDVTTENTRHTFCFLFLFLLFWRSWNGHDCIMSSAQFPVGADDTVFSPVRSFSVCYFPTNAFFFVWLRLLNVVFRSAKSRALALQNPLSETHRKWLHTAYVWDNRLSEIDGERDEMSGVKRAANNAKKREIVYIGCVGRMLYLLSMTLSLNEKWQRCRMRSSVCSSASHSCDLYHWTAQTYSLVEIQVWLLLLMPVNDFAFVVGSAPATRRKMNADYIIYEHISFGNNSNNTLRLSLRFSSRLAAEMTWNSTTR